MSVISSMSASAAVSSGAAIVEVANFLKDYMNAMEQLPRTAQLLASQMMDLDKNSHCTLIELEELTQPGNLSSGSVPVELRRRLKRSLIDLQTGADEQHRLLGDVGESIQRHVHRIQAQRKQAEVQLRNLQSKAFSASKQQDVLEPSTSSREVSSTKRKRVRESVGSVAPAKHAKRQPKDASPGPSVASSTSSAPVRRTGGALTHRKASTSSSVSAKKTPASTPTATTPVTPNPPVTSVKKKKKKKRKSMTTVTPNEKLLGPGGMSAPSEKAIGSANTVTTGSGGSGKGGRKRQEGGAGAITAEGGASSSSSAAHEEPRYCLCGGVSSGPMVACDGHGCQVEWFHFECVGLTEAPKGNWYCSKCEQNAAARPSRRAKGKSTASASSGTVGSTR